MFAAVPSHSLSLTRTHTHISLTLLTHTHLSLSFFLSHSLPLPSLSFSLYLSLSLSLSIYLFYPYFFHSIYLFFRECDIIKRSYCDSHRIARKERGLISLSRTNVTPCRKKNISTPICFFSSPVMRVCERKRERDNWRERASVRGRERVWVEWRVVHFASVCVCERERKRNKRVFKNDLTNHCSK